MVASAIVGAVVLFSLVRGLSSVSSKDVLGKTIPKTRRGRVTGLAASVSGALTLVVGLWLLIRRQQDPSPAFYGALLATAAGLWLASALIYSRIEEYPGATDGGGNALREAFERLSILASDADFRRFVVARSLLVSTALVAPYYVVLARQRTGEKLALLGLFIVAGGLASSLSAYFWGRWADASSRRVWSPRQRWRASSGWRSLRLRNSRRGSPTRRGSTAPRSSCWGSRTAACAWDARPMWLTWWAATSAPTTWP